MTPQLQERILARPQPLPPLQLEPVRRVNGGPPPERARQRGWLIRRCLLLSDVLAMVASFWLAELLVTDSMVDRGEASALVYPAVGLVILLLLTAHGLYGRDEFRADHTTTDDLPAIFNAVTIGAFGSLAVLIAIGVAALKLPIVAWAVMLVTMPALRGLGRVVARRRPEYLQNTIIVGGGAIGQLMARKLLSHPEYGLRLVGLVDDDPQPRTEGVQAVRVVGGPGQIGQIVADNQVERAIVAFSGQSHDEELALIRRLRDLDLQVDIVPRLFEIVGPSAGINVFEGLSVVALPPRRISRARLAVKRTADVVLSAAAIVATLPVAVAIAVAIVVNDRGPLLYRGERIGPGGRRFMQLKFRTMSHWTPEDFDRWLEDHPAEAATFERTQKLTNDPRVTRVGRFLRRTSLDELPQLWNVLRGDLSLVGPRPITELEQRDRYHREAIHPHCADALGFGYWDVEGMRPGLTGYWQISGRSTMSFQERIRLDTAYLSNWSLSLDAAILARTIRALFTARGAY
jgi:exopolysaccharide biosynthesis polyprenyl glycosylphosphotransferase